MSGWLLLLALAVPPTPGPLERAGAAADQALRRAARSVADAVLEGKVKVALLEHLKAEAMRIEVEAIAGTVVLSGTVKQRSSVMVAGEVARSVKGVASVKNFLRWELTPGQRPPKLGEVKGSLADQILEGKVKVRLLEELGRTAFAIEVEVSSSVVVLSGTVDSPEKRKLAVAVAKATPGVRQVHDLMRGQE